MTTPDLRQRCTRENSPTALAELVAEATFPDLRRAPAVTDSVPSEAVTLDGQHGETPAP